MIQKQGAYQTVTCDECGAEFADSFRPDEFLTMIHAVRNEGWRVFKEDDLWCHQCPDCRPEPSNGLAAQRRLLGR